MSKSSIKKNLLYQMIYELLVLILPFVTSPYIARVVGAEGLGIYSYSYTIANYFVIFSMLGLKNYGNRIIAQTREDIQKLNTVFSEVLSLHMFVSVFCCIMYAVYILFIAADKQYAAIQSLFVLSGLFDISWFYFGIEKFKLTVTRNTVIKIINVICIFVFVKKSDDLWKYCIIMALGMLISQLTLWIPLKKYVRIVKPNFKQIFVHIKPMLILFIPVIAISLYKYMDKIMIGGISSKTQLGLYENAEKVTIIPLTIIGSFGTVMLPKMSNLAAKSDIGSSLRYMKISMKYVMCLALALAFGLAAVGQVFAPLFWGKEFEASGILIMGLSITIPFASFANVIRTQYLIPQSKDKDYLVSVIAGAVVNLIINYLFIPDFGAIGATIGTIAAEVLVCIIQSYSVRKAIPLFDYFKSFYAFIIFGLIMFVIVFYIGKISNGNIVTLIIQVMVGVILYGILSLVYLLNKKDEIVTGLLSKIKKK